MLKRLADNLEQLDLALEHLSKGDANNARFALMLTDNAVELTLHQIALQYADGRSGWRRESNLPFQRELDAALGRHFDAKVKLAKLLGYLSEAVGETVTTAHSYRNEVYHVGLEHEEILPALSRFYFLVACDVLASFKPNGIGWGSNQKLPERAKKFFSGKDRHMPGTREEYYQACRWLKDQVADGRAVLVAAVTSHMERVIDETDGYIEYLKGGYPSGKQPTRKEILIECQAWPITFSEDGKAFIRSNPPPEKTVHGIVQWIGAQYPRIVRTDPVPSWRDRLAAVRRERDAHSALKRYQSFMDQTSSLREWIGEATAALDARVEEEIERMRGK
jgi:hypothetical protein